MSRGLDWGAAREREAARRAPTASMPTLAQVEYIARLTEELGVSLAAAPATAREASDVIDALRKRRARLRRA